jgi:hypothetical protein
LGAAGIAGSSASLADAGYPAHMSGLGPVAWWRFGDAASSTVALDSSGRGHHGTYVNAPSLGGSGAIMQDADTALTVGASNAQYVSVPDSDDFSLVKGQDLFSRAVAGGLSWGTADNGGSWTPAFTASGTYYSCDGTRARINQSGAAATWGQILDLQRKDVDLQVKASWSVGAAGSVTAPVGLMARYMDSQNYYRADLRENAGGQLDLRLIKVVAGVSTVLATAASVGTYFPGDEWYVRFQVNGSSLRASAWKKDVNLIPWTWQVQHTDASLASAGKVGIRSTNSGATSRPIVSFDDFRAQSVGMTILGWVRPDALSFDGLTGEPYIYWISKGEVNTNLEYAFRFYSGTAVARPNRLSSYAFNTNGGLGAGAYFQDLLSIGAWIQIVAVFDPGDRLDDSAGVAIYRDSVLRQGPVASAATRYSHPEYLVTPVNGTAVLRIGGSHQTNAWSYFTGGIDEVAIFDRKLTQAEISALHAISR